MVVSLFQLLAAVFDARVIVAKSSSISRPYFCFGLEFFLLNNAEEITKLLWKAIWLSNEDFCDTYRRGEKVAAKYY